MSIAPLCSPILPNACKGQGPGVPSWDPSRGSLRLVNSAKAPVHAPHPSNPSAACPCWVTGDRSEWQLPCQGPEPSPLLLFGAFRAEALASHSQVWICGSVRDSWRGWGVGRSCHCLSLGCQCRQQTTRSPEGSSRPPSPGGLVGCRGQKGSSLWSF